MKRIRAQHGFISIAVLALLAAFILFMKAWFETETRKHVAKRYSSIVAGQEQVFRSLSNYFAILCQQNSGFTSSTVTLSDMTTLGTYNPNLVLRPDHLDYHLQVTRPGHSFNYNGQVVADGSTTFTLTFSARDDRETALLAEAMAEREMRYAVSGHDFTLTMDYQLEVSQAGYDSLHGGGDGYLCR